MNDNRSEGASGWPVIEVPKLLRSLVRARESGLVVLGALIGAVGAVVVEGMNLAVRALHAVFFDIPFGQRLSATVSLTPVRAIAVPVLGGLLLGLAYFLIRKWRPGREVDPIEANALHGGRMSLIGSVLVALQTVWSCGVGASVGLEAGFTQLASGLASWLGLKFRLRRKDLRTFVGCGTAAAIAAAFGAPLAGAFYAFELIVAGYSTATLAPVGAAALVGYLVSQQFQPAMLSLGELNSFQVGRNDFIFAALLGVTAALVGILIMRGVALSERLFSDRRLPQFARPALAGLCVGGVALITPQVMASGHGAMHMATIVHVTTQEVIFLFVLKIFASVISLGGGFRGGLFFASLLLGALGGRIFAAALSAIFPALALDPTIYVVVGMSALAVAVIGGPLTMTFIALETTGDLWLTTVVLIAVIVSMQATRELFGYSFTTWRFHLRGETIRSAADVGWIRELTVRRLMRADVKTVPAHTTISRFRMVFPLGSTTSVVAVDENQLYAGMINVAEAHSTGLDASQPVRTILHTKNVTLFPAMMIDRAVAAFEKAEAESLAVVESEQQPRVVGLVTEAYALRRYADELEMRRRDSID